MQGIIISFEYLPWCPLILLKYNFLKKNGVSRWKSTFSRNSIFKTKSYCKSYKKKGLKNRNICLCITNIIGLL